MKRIIELRDDGPTAAYISDALRLQAQFGHEHAADYLKALGVGAELAHRMLGIGYDRRRPSIATTVRMGREDSSAIRIPA